FTLGVFSRDTGVLYTVVVVALIAAFTLKDNRHAWKTVILRSLPYCLVAVIYVAVRLLIVGLPKTGTAGVYTLRFEPSHFLKYAAIYAGSLFNVTVASPASMGQGDVFTALIPGAHLRLLCEAGFLTVAVMLFAVTILRGVRSDWRIAFALLWGIVLIVP